MHHSVERPDTRGVMDHRGRRDDIQQATAYGIWIVLYIIMICNSLSDSSENLKSCKQFLPTVLYTITHEILP